MKPAQIAALIEEGASPETNKRLRALLDFFGIGWQSFPSAAEFSARADGANFRAVIASLPAYLRISSGASLFFLHGSEDERACSQALNFVTGEIGAVFEPFRGQRVKAAVTTEEPKLTGPMHGLELHGEPRPGDRFAKLKNADAISPIVTTDAGPVFFAFEKNGARIFVSASSEIPDLDAPIEGRGYDVRAEFFSAVPLVMFLRWAFAESSWRPNETGACWIVDDPLLRTKYGFCDFRLLDAQMKEHAFTTNIAMIPWNARRTSPEMAAMIGRSQGRLSVSMHGCDHTAAEFGTDDAGELHLKVNTASERMTQHRDRTGVAHDRIMVFPQGIFSRGSLRTLQAHEFAAAVNTDTLPHRERNERVTTRDAWSVAITKYGGFPLFTRRYPADGLENFAFDVLLGKPCLVVEHHGFFKDGHREVLRFAQALNSLHAPLQWRALGEVIRRSFLWRTEADGSVRVRMFANELLLRNAGTTEREYRIEKPDAGSVGVREVRADGQPIEWQTDGYTLNFSCKIASGAEVLLQVRYHPPSEKNGHRREPVSAVAKVAARRYLSEFRDNFLSRHDGLMALAQRAKRFAGKSRV